MTSTAETTRAPEIDWAKGLAIIGVLLIHSSVFINTPLDAPLINRSVPVLIVLFGMTSQLWWTRERARMRGALVWQWFRMRLARLMLPVWVTLVALWCVRIAAHEMGSYEVRAAYFLFLLIGATALVSAQQWLTSRWRERQRAPAPAPTRAEDAARR